MVTITKGFNGFGVDIIAQQQGIKYAVQVKRHFKKVSRRAVSDAVAGKQHFRCDRAMVITNCYFSDGATTLAHSTGGILVDRETLSAWIPSHQKIGIGL